MFARLLRGFLPAALAGTFGLQVAHADIYTWVDASGALNVSNLAPPEGVRLTRVIHERAPKTAASDDTAREAARQSEVQALAARVRQLEDEVELAQRQMPPMEFRVASPPPLVQPPVVQYFVDVAPPVQYVNAAAPATGGCYPTWTDCGLGWIPGFYPTSVVVLQAQNFRNVHPGRGGQQFPGRPPMRPPGPFAGALTSVPGVGSMNPLHQVPHPRQPDRPGSRSG